MFLPVEKRASILVIRLFRMVQLLRAFLGGPLFFSSIPTPLAGSGIALQCPFLEACEYSTSAPNVRTLRAFTIWQCSDLNSIRWHLLSMALSTNAQPPLRKRDRGKNKWYRNRSKESHGMPSLVSNLAPSLPTLRLCRVCPGRCLWPDDFNQQIPTSAQEEVRIEAATLWNTDSGKASHGRRWPQRSGPHPAEYFLKFFNFCLDGSTQIRCRWYPSLLRYRGRRRCLPKSRIFFG